MVSFYLYVTEFKVNVHIFFISLGLVTQYLYRVWYKSNGIYRSVLIVLIKIATKSQTLINGCDVYNDEYSVRYFIKKHEFITKYYNT